VKSKQRWYQRHQLFNHSIDPALHTWLFDKSSLTARLLGLCGSHFSVRVISQHYEKIDFSEASTMVLQKAHSALVRQVLLCCDEQPLVYARTVIPVTTIQGAQRRYANMGNRPLGAMLFADRTMQREAVEVSMLPASHEANQYTNSNGPIWGRRSVFRVSGKPLLVSEYFLPELLTRS
jgi:chorismate--pyruvate lyase